MADLAAQVGQAAHPVHAREGLVGRREPVVLRTGGVRGRGRRGRHVQLLPILEATEGVLASMVMFLPVTGQKALFFGPCGGPMVASTSLGEGL